MENVSTGGTFRISDTATLPYPTHQAITTPPSSHYRGDFGLKRPLPKKTISRSTPHVRIAAQDNTEHITDFGSAADHTQTLAKWDEMGVPIILRSGASRGSRRPPPKSVFDSDLDNISTNKRAVDAAARWKHGGPWLASMGLGEFDNLVKQLLSRRSADTGQRDVKGASRVAQFRDFVSDRLVERNLADEKLRAQEQGEHLSLAEQDSLRASLRPSDEQLDDHIRTLRQEHSEKHLKSELTRLICDFLDLPPMLTEEDDDLGTGSRSKRFMRNLNLMMSDEQGPPSTHPSAGLSYLRSNAIMENHPIHGPQAHHSPVLARVVRPKHSVTGAAEYQAKIGVGGIVTNDPVTSVYNPDNTPAGPPEPIRALAKHDPSIMANALDPHLEGGNKMWVHPQSAYIDEAGRIRLDVTRAGREAVAVKTDDVEPINAAKEAAERRYLDMSTATFGSYPVGMASFAPRGTAANANFGHSLPNLRQPVEGQTQLEMPNVLRRNNAASSGSQQWRPSGGGSQGGALGAIQELLNTTNRGQRR